MVLKIVVDGWVGWVYRYHVNGCPVVRLGILTVLAIQCLKEFTGATCRANITLCDLAYIRDNVCKNGPIQQYYTDLTLI